MSSYFAEHDTPVFKKNVRSSRPVLRPQLDVSSDDTGLHLYFNLPGVREEDVDLITHRGELRLRAERRLPSLKGRIHSFEFCDALFESVLSLPESVKISDIEASFSNGTLHVYLPCQPEGKERTRIVLKSKADSGEE